MRGDEGIHSIILLQNLWEKGLGRRLKGLRVVGITGSPGP